LVVRVKNQEVIAVTIGRWPMRRWLAAVIAMGLTALVIGIPTGITLSVNLV